MKKLKAVLILLLALLLSLGLFACGGGEDENNNDNDNPNDQDDPNKDDDEGDGYYNFSLSESVINLTDSDDKAALEAKVNAIKVTARDYNGEATDIPLSQCEYDLNVVDIQEVGEYKVQFSIKDVEIATNRATLTVVIDHDWETQGDVDVCKHDGARRETVDEDVVIHYGDFHQGTDPQGYAAAKAAGQWAEDAAYTNKKDVSSIKEFGEVNGRKVPTLTAGQLEKGMTITISGQVMTTVGDENGVGSPWNAPQKHYNSPSLGIADRYNTSVQNGSREYLYGVSVIVREEGWVLYNGISGKGADRLLAGIMGSDSEDISTWRNYGSHVDATDTLTPGTVAEAAGYTHGSIPTDWSSIGDWWVYSEGTIMRSSAYYTTWTNYEYTWNYRDDGVIEIIYKTWGESETVADAVSLKAYIKVPDSTSGYYDTIIHGDYNDMTIKKTVTITKRTPMDNGFAYHDLAADKKLVYAENTQFDASALNVTVKYVQSPNEETPLQVYNNQVYYYVGNLSRADLEKDENKAVKESVDSSVWKPLDQNMLTLKADGSQYIYKIQLTKGGKQFVHLLPEGEITVKANSVTTVTGSDVSIGEMLFANGGKVGDLAFSFDGTNVKFTLASGYAQPMSDEQKTAIGGEGSYVALRLDKAALGAAFDVNALTVKMGNDNVPFKAVTVDYEGRSDLYLVLALSKAGVVTLTGVQATPIVLDLSALKGFSVTSTVEGVENLKLNKGGELTLNYKLPAGTAENDIQLFMGTSSVRVSQLRNLTLPFSIGGVYTIKSFDYNDAAGSLTVVMTIGAANLANYAPLSFELRLPSDSVVDTVNYSMQLDSADGYVAGANGYYAYVTESGKLNVVWATGESKLADGKVNGKFTVNINNGNLENFKKNGLTSVEFAVENGKLVLVNAPAYVTGNATIVGTYGNDRDKDAGAFVVLTIDVATGLEITGDYYVEFVDGVFDAVTAPTKVNNVSGNKLTVVDVPGTAKPISTGDGNCYEEGIYAWEVKDGENVVCYVNAASAGGEHIFGNDGVCILCGAKPSAVTTKADTFAWYGDHTTHTLNAGDIVETRASFKDSASVYGNGFAILLFEKNTSNQNIGLFVFTALGDVAYNTPPEAGGDVWLNRGGPHAEVGEFVDNPDRVNNPHITEEHPYNTFNGVLDKDGQAIATESISSYMKGGQIRYIVTHYGDTIEVTMMFYVAGQTYEDTPQYQETYTVKGTSGNRYEVWTMGNDQNNVKPDNMSIDVILSTVVKSSIDKIETADVDGHAASDRVVLKASAAEGVYDVVKVSGFAANADSAYYASFKITFKQALVSSTSVKLVDADGKEIGKAILAEDKTSVEVYLPITSGLKAAYLDFTNYQASSKQADIKLDLNDLVTSDVVSTVSEDQRTIDGGTIKITYTNVQNSDKLVIGDVSKALSELGTIADLGSGYKAQATIEGTTATVTITSPAADLTKAIAGIEVRLERGSDLMARDVLSAAVTVSGGRELDDTGWYVKANGTQLILFSQAGGTLKLNLNAGEKTAKDHVKVYDLSLDTKGEFVNANSYLAKASRIVVSKGQEKAIYVLVIDLTSFGVEAATPYGYQNGADGVTKYYTVNAERAIADVTAVTEGKTQTTLLEKSCVSDEVKVYVTDGKDFYYNIAFTAAEGHKFEAKADASADELHGYDTMEVCSVCQAVRYSQTEVTQSWGTKAAWEGGDTGYINVGVVHKGGSYEITGTLESLGTQNYHLMTPGINSVGPEANETTGAVGFRIDHWIMNMAGDNLSAYPGGQPEANPGVAYTVHDNKTDADVSYDSVANTLRGAYNGATVTYTFDYLNDSRFIIGCRVVKGDVDVTVTFTLTGSLLDTYYVFLHPDGCKYNASTVTTVVPKDASVSKALTKHQHAYDPQTHRCPTDGALDPAHTTHEYSDTTDRCACGAINPEHAHKFENGQCTICGLPQAGAMTVTAGDKTYDATLVDGAIVNNDTAENNGLAWWGDGTGSSQTQLGETDFVVILAWNQLTIDPNYGYDAIIELTDGTNYFDLAFFKFNDDGTVNQWGTLVAGGADGADPQAPTHARTITVNGEAKETNAAAYVGSWTGFYSVKLVRVGSTLTVTSTLVSLDGLTVTVVTDTYTGFTTAALKAGVVGNPYACEDLVLFHSGLTAKA